MYFFIVLVSGCVIRKKTLAMGRAMVMRLWPRNETSWGLETRATGPLGLGQGRRLVHRRFQMSLVGTWEWD